LQKELKIFGIIDISAVNFVKALKNYSSYFCFVHRLNNILVLSFYQAESIKAQTSSSSDLTAGNVFSSEDLVNGSILDGNIDEMIFVDISKTKIKDLPNCSREVLKVLTNCKDIVKYVKVVS
jgi:hypothetical protein